MSVLTQKLRHWSYHRQLLNKKGVTLSETLEQVIGVYSAHPSGPLSLYARSSDFSLEKFIALDAKKLAFRTPAMRESIFLLPSKTAHLVRSASLPSVEDPCWEKRYSEPGRTLPIEYYSEWKNEILALTKTPLSGKEIKEQSSVPHDKVKFLLNRMAYEGSLFRVGAKSMRSNLISYVSSESWSDGKFIIKDPESSRIWLADAYLRAFGPARIKDFSWWAGISLKEAKSVVDQLKTTSVGEENLILQSDLHAFHSSQPTDNETIDILPQWDCYLMGYAPDGRQRLLDTEFIPSVYGKLGATGGNALGTVLLKGKVEGFWTSRFKGTHMEITLKMLHPLSKRIMNLIYTRFEEISRLLGAKKINWTA